MYLRAVESVALHHATSSARLFADDPFVDTYIIIYVSYNTCRVFAKSIYNVKFASSNLGTHLENAGGLYSVLFDFFSVGVVTWWKCKLP